MGEEVLLKMSNWLRNRLNIRQKHALKYCRALFAISHFRSLLPFVQTLSTVGTKPEIFFRSLTPQAIAEPLERIGGNKDGGYLVPKTGIQCDGLISPGVGDSFSFEIEFVRENHRAVLIDATVAEPADLPTNMIFLSKMIGGTATLDGVFVTLQDVRRDFFPTSKSLALQMDIEGAEYEVLENMSRDDFDGMNLLLIEFHNLHEMLSFPITSNPLLKALELLKEDFSLVHTHPNNAGGFFLSRVRVFPKVVETTWVRKSLVTLVAGKPHLPHELDLPNDPLIWDLSYPTIG